MDLLYILGYYSTACVYFSFRWGPFAHSLGIIQWNFTRRDHPGKPGRVSGSGPVIGRGKTSVTGRDSEEEKKGESSKKVTSAERKYR